MYKTLQHKIKQHNQSVQQQKRKGNVLNDNRLTIQQKPNNTGLPDQLKTGIENLSGHTMDDVKVHYNSSKPATVQAHAYAQGTNIHLASGQEKHLPHEAWHIVQQKQGRVKPTTTINGMAVNDNASLEKEADVMGAKAVQMQSKTNKQKSIVNTQKVKQKLGLVDNRPKAVTQTKLLDNNPHSTQLKVKHSATSKTIQRVASTDIKKSNALFSINNKLSKNYKSYLAKVKLIDSSVKNNYANGLLNWAVQYHKEAAGSDAELRRVIYHEEKFAAKKGNEMRLGKNNTSESDIVGKVGGKARSEEVKAVTTTSSNTVKNQINAALLQLEDPRAISKATRKVVVYIYNNRNPWPYDSIAEAKGKSEAQIKSKAINILKSKHKRVKGGIHITVNDINKFSKSGKNTGATNVEMTWPNAGETSPTKRRKNIDAEVTTAGTPLKFRKN